MTPLMTDIILLSILFISAVIAFVRGFIKEVLTIFSLLGAGAAAYIWGGATSPFFENWGEGLAGESGRIWGMIPPEIFGVVLGYGAIFLALFILFSIMSHFIGKMVQDMGLGSVDRTLGFAFGLGRGLLILALINIPILGLIPKAEQSTWLKDAKIMTLINQTSEWVLSLNPSDDDEPKETVLEAKDLTDIKNSIEAIKERAKMTGDTVLEEGVGYQEKARDSLDDLINNVEQ